MAVSISKVNSLPTNVASLSSGSRCILPNGKEYILNNSKQWIPLHMLALEMKVDLTTENLNSVTSYGIYLQNQNVNATVERNYPSPGSAGILKVFTNGNDVYQEFQVLSGQVNENKTYTRGLYGGVWSSWLVPNFVNFTQAEWNTVKTNSHTHSNKTNLDSINQDLNRSSSVIFDKLFVNNSLIFGVNAFKFYSSTYNSADPLTIGNAFSGNLPQVVFTGGLVASDNYAYDGQYLPLNGIYSKGVIKTKNNLSSEEWKQAYDWGNHATAGYLNLTQADVKYVKLNNNGEPQSIDSGELIITDTFNQNTMYFTPGTVFASVNYNELSVNRFGFHSRYINGSSAKTFIGISIFNKFTETTTETKFIEYDSVINKLTFASHNPIYFEPLNLGTTGATKTLTLDSAGKLGYINGTPLMSFTETDPTVPSHVKAITQTNLNSWNSVAQNYLGYVDDRIISPNDLGTKKIQFGFTSFTNNNTTPWADFIHFGGYQDASGGNQNLIVFNKTNFGIRQYQGTFQSGTSYNNYVDYWHSGNFNPSDYSMKSANETFGGVKTFTLSPIIPNATSQNHAVNKEQLDAKIPYTGATANVNLGATNQIRAKEFDAIGAYAEKPNTNRNYEFVKLNGSTIGVYQSQVWNGSAWADSSSNGFGFVALQYNKGRYSNGFGFGTLQYNTGNNSNGFGVWALTYNTGNYSNGFGYYALTYNTGNNSNGFGYNALRYNTGSNNSVLGYNSFSDFYADTVNAKLFDATAIDIVAKTITIPNHAFGANGTYTNLRFVQGDSAVTGLSNGAIVQVKIIDANTIAYEEVIQAGQVRRNVNITNAGTGTGHKFEPQKSLSNINILGANINPTKSNQTIFAGGEAILPQSTVATIDADATNKALITKEWYNSKTSASLSNYYTKSETVNMFVGLNGAQTIGGTKAFNESPIIPTPTLSTHAVNKNYVDVQLGSYMPTTHVANSITPTNIANWNTAYGWGNHASAGYAMANHTHSWNEIENKPLTFVPTSHTHAISEVTGLSTELDEKSEKNADEEWYGKKYLSNTFPLVFNDPTEATERFGFHKPNNKTSVILVPSTESDSDNWNWANQIEFKENGKIKNNGYEIAGSDDNYVPTAGGGNAHKRDLLWTKKDTYDADGSTTVITPKGLLTTIHISGNTDTSTRFVLPRSATNGQKILFINDSPAAWVEVFDSTETIGAKAHNSENLEFTFVRELDGEGVLSGNGNWHAFSHVDGKIKL